MSPRFNLLKPTAIYNVIKPVTKPATKRVPVWHGWKKRKDPMPICHRLAISNSKKLPESFELAVVACYLQNMEMKKIRELFEIAHGTIYLILKRRGIKRKGRKRFFDRPQS